MMNFSQIVFVFVPQKTIQNSVNTFFKICSHVYVFINQ